MAKKKQEITYRFHNPNTSPEGQERLKKVLLDVCFQAAKDKVDKIIMDEMEKEKPPVQQEETQSCIEKMEEISSDEGLARAANRALIEAYPFLLPRNRFSHEVPDDYDYSYTELDEMPSGWRKAFGEQMIGELRDILKEGDCLDSYRIVQIKEKYGVLHWYDEGYPTKVQDKMRAWSNKYEDLSVRTCIDCGRPATVISIGWISPFCDRCKDSKRTYMKLEEFLHKKC